jgi:hypothetical protein
VIGKIRLFPRLKALFTKTDALANIPASNGL